MPREGFYFLNVASKGGPHFIEANKQQFCSYPASLQRLDFLSPVRINEILSKVNVKVGLGRVLVAVPGYPRVF